MESPISDKLINAGYSQKRGGYIKYAKECGIDNPSQYWHLIESWSNRSDPNATFGRNIKCGELLFWMAEVSGATTEDELTQLADLLIREYIDESKYAEGNRIIQQHLFDKIVHAVESTL